MTNSNSCLQADATFKDLMAEGGYGKVYEGAYAGHRVAIKVLKQALDPELSPEVAEDFARECATLMSVRMTHEKGLMCVRAVVAKVG